MKTENVKAIKEKWFIKADGWVAPNRNSKNWYGILIAAAVKIIPNAIQQGVHHRRILRSEKQADRFLRQADRTEKSCLPDKSIRGYNSQISSLQTGHLRGDGPLRKDLELLASNLGIADKVSFPVTLTEIRKKIERLFTVSEAIRLRLYAQRTDGSRWF